MIKTFNAILKLDKPLNSLSSRTVLQMAMIFLGGLITLSANALSIETAEPSAISVNKISGVSVHSLQVLPVSVKAQDIDHMGGSERVSYRDIHQLGVGFAKNSFALDDFSSAPALSNEFTAPYQQAENLIQQLERQAAQQSSLIDTATIIEEWQVLKPQLNQLIKKQQEVDELLSYIQKLKRVAMSPVALPSDLNGSPRCQESASGYRWPKCLDTTTYLKD